MKLSGLYHALRYELARACSIKYGEERIGPFHWEAADDEIDGMSNTELLKMLASVEEND